MSPLLLSLIIIVTAAQLFGAAAERFLQPPVIGEIIAGILLGPTLLGHFLPGLEAYVFNGQVRSILDALSQVGVILFMFLVGLEFNDSILKEKSKAVFFIAYTGIVAPFLLGAGISVLLFSRYAGVSATPVSFALFAGISIAVTAFPVLARILSERGILKTALGKLALACAAICDATAWCILALVVGLARAVPGPALLNIGYLGAYVLAMLCLVRPFLGRIITASDERAHSPTAFAWLIVAILTSAFVTSSLGAHAIFGAFLLGALIPSHSKFAGTVTARLEHVVSALFLPIFFMMTGLQTHLSLIHGSAWIVCAAIIVVATIGKFGGTFVAARMSGMAATESLALGSLMNSRGLMELIVLSIGLELHIFSATLFAMMVIMAIATTLVTSPLLEVLLRASKVSQENGGLQLPVVLDPGAEHLLLRGRGHPEDSP